MFTKDTSVFIFFSCSWEEVFLKLLIFENQNQNFISPHSQASRANVGLSPSSFNLTGNRKAPAGLSKDEKCCFLQSEFCFQTLWIFQFSSQHGSLSKQTFSLRKRSNYLSTCASPPSPTLPVCTLRHRSESRVVDQKSKCLLVWIVEKTPPQLDTLLNGKK